MPHHALIHGEPSPKAFFDKDHLAEFDQLNDWRFHTWYVDPNAKTLISRVDFIVAQDLLEKGLFRKPSYLAFQYNQTDSTYNSSTIVLNNFRFLALEAPTAKTLRNFYLLLLNHRVTQLVRLTAATENGIERSTPYWLDKTKGDPTTGNAFLNVPQVASTNPYPVRYYATDNWFDNQSIAPSQLLKLILNVKKHYDPNGLIACHSSNGTGRAGTFLAGFLLISEIDRQIATGTAPSAVDISIERVVMQLSLQRPYMVRKAEQYVTLYRLVDLYISQMKK